MRKGNVGRRMLAGAGSVLVALVCGGPLGCDLFKPPEAPKLVEDKGGNCCVKRDSVLSQTACSAPGSRCCSGKFASDVCEQKGGVWYFTPEGCDGAGQQC